MQLCTLTTLRAPDECSGMKSRETDELCPWTWNQTAPLACSLKNAAPTPSLEGIFDVPVAPHHLKKHQNDLCEVVTLSFEAQPCVSLADISSL